MPQLALANMNPPFTLSPLFAPKSMGFFFRDNIRHQLIRYVSKGALPNTA